MALPKGRSGGGFDAEVMNSYREICCNSVASCKSLAFIIAGRSNLNLLENDPQRRVAVCGANGQGFLFPFG
jgi:hypothetical protein